ncbi:hypothetical protein NFI96_026938 [Prochilodus magdalenae]|nr:hypothetical protein NFI96_026938 [Prochilodus magdalenae]
MGKGSETIKGQNLNTLNFSLPGSSKAQDPQDQKRSAKQPRQQKADTAESTEAKGSPTGVFPGTMEAPTNTLYESLKRADMA